MNSGQGKLFAGMTLWGQGRNADSSRLRNITYSTEFADLFPEAMRSWPWVPRFTHELLDQTTLEPEAVAGNVKGRITQLLMMAAFNRHVEAALQLTAQLILSLRPPPV